MQSLSPCGIDRFPSAFLFAEFSNIPRGNVYGFVQLSIRIRKYYDVLILTLSISYGIVPPKRRCDIPRKSPYKIVLTPEEKEGLKKMAQKYTSPYFKVVRAKVILFASEGLENKEIAKRVDMPRQIVSKWRKRFFEQRLAGLQDRPRRGRPSRFSP